MLTLLGILCIAVGIYVCMNSGRSLSLIYKECQVLKKQYLSALDELANRIEYVINHIPENEMEQIRFLKISDVIQNKENKVMLILKLYSLSDAVRIDKKETQKESSAVEQIVSCLNEKAGTAFRASTRQTQKHIRARLSEGYSPGDFEAVIAYKVSKWKDDPRMQGYLRPETLFGSKFEGYLQEARQQTAVYQNIVPDTGLLDEWGVQ